jgi:LCP family protein required for cell wall assembly
VRTTLKRGFGRSADLNGNGHAAYAPLLTPVARYRQPPPPPRSAWRLVAKAFLWLVIVVVMLAGGMLGGLYLREQRFTLRTQPKGANKAAAQRLDTLSSPRKPAIALLIGSDHRYRIAGARSDTIMLIRTDPVNETVSLLSFPRDLRVPIYCPGHSVFLAKINMAFETCGPIGTVETVKALTHLPINYLIAVNFVGFIQVVDRLGGVWIDVDRRYFNNHTGPGGYAAIDLHAGYQHLTGSQALDFVRYRHTDSDLYRAARQQLFVRAAKEQMSRFSIQKALRIANALESSVEIGRAGGNGVDPSTLNNYLGFLHALPPGHFFQAKIDPNAIAQEVGSSDLTVSQSAVDQAVQEFLNPDVQAPAKATAAALGLRYRPKVTSVRPWSVTITVLNGNGVTGSAALAGTLLKQRRYNILQPPPGVDANAPGGWNYPVTRVYFDSRQAKSKAAARQVEKLFGSAQTGPMPHRVAAKANGAMLAVVVGKSFTGSLTAPPASASKPPPRQPPQTIYEPAATSSLLRPLRAKVPFPLELPTRIERTSQPDATEPVRLYDLAGRKAVRLVFSTGVPGEFWGIEETAWTTAPALLERNFTRHLGRRLYAFYYSGAHLHMIVLRENGATYWVVNTLSDRLSNETMISIAKGLRPLARR